MPSYHPDYKPGDLIGFSYCGSAGVLINLGTFGIPFYSLSHLGILACHPDRMDKKPLLWESTIKCKLPCLIQGETVDGIQAHSIPLRVSEYKGKVWHYPLSVPLEDWQSEKLSRFCYDALGVTYDKIGVFNTILSRRNWFGWDHPAEDLTSLFCSEFVVACLRLIHLIRGTNASRWSPNSAGRFVLRKGVCTKPYQVK